MEYKTILFMESSSQSSGPPPIPAVGRSCSLLPCSECCNSGPVEEERTHFSIGTPYFMAPELLRNETGPSTASDVYAFGILIFEGAPLLIGSSAASL